jgi:hypothetical protein
MTVSCRPAEPVSGRPGVLTSRDTGGPAYRCPSIQVSQDTGVMAGVPRRRHPGVPAYLSRLHREQLAIG